MCSEGDNQRRHGRRARAAFAVVALMAFHASSALGATGTIAYTHSDRYQVPFTVMPWEYAIDPRIDVTDIASATRRLMPAVASAPAWSPDGTWLAFAAERPGRSVAQIFLARPDGTGIRAVTRASHDWTDADPSWSPDGSELAFRRPGWGLYQVSATGGRARKLTSGGFDSHPSWGRDGRITFARFAGGHWRIFAIAPDGTGLAKLTSGTTDDEEPSWSPDGSRIAFARESADRIDVFTMRADGTDVRQVTAAGPDEANRTPAWSPDGTAIAYSGWGPYGNDHEILVIDLISSAVRRLTDNFGDDLAPAWRPQALALAAGKRRPLAGRRKPLAGLVRWIRSPQEGNGSECMSYRPFLPQGPLLTFHTHQSSGEVRHGGRQEVGTRGFTCAYGFAQGQRKRFRVFLTHPDGRVERLRPNNAYGASTIAYWVARRQTEGLYRVDVVKGSQEAHTTFRVVAPESPHLVVLDPQERSDVVRRLGRSVQILVTGLPPRARPWLDLYRGAPSRVGHKYFNSVQVRARLDGSALYRLPTSRHDRPGSYLVIVRLGKRQYSGAEFVMRR